MRAVPGLPGLRKADAGRADFLYYSRGRGRGQGMGENCNITVIISRRAPGSRPSVFLDKTLPPRYNENGIERPDPDRIFFRRGMRK